MSSDPSIIHPANQMTGRPVHKQQSGDSKRDVIFITLPENMDSALDIFFPLSRPQLTNTAINAILSVDSYTKDQNCLAPYGRRGESVANVFIQMLEKRIRPKSSNTLSSYSSDSDVASLISDFMEILIMKLVKILAHPMINSLPTEDSVHLAMFYALRQQQLDFAIFLAHSRINRFSPFCWFISRKNAQRTTALHMAAAVSCESVCRKLLQCGWNANETDFDGKFPYQLVPASTASTSQNSALVSLLRDARFGQHGASSSVSTDPVPPMSPSQHSSLKSSSSTGSSNSSSNVAKNSPTLDHKQRLDSNIRLGIIGSAPNLASSFSQNFIKRDSGTDEAASPALMLTGLVRSRSWSQRPGTERNSPPRDGKSERGLNQNTNDRKDSGSGFDSPLELLAKTAETVLVGSTPTPNSSPPSAWERRSFRSSISGHSNHHPYSNDSSRKTSSSSSTGIVLPGFYRRNDDKTSFPPSPGSLSNLGSPLTPFTEDSAAASPMNPATLIMMMSRSTLSPMETDRKSEIPISRRSLNCILGKQPPSVSSSSLSTIPESRKSFSGVSGGSSTRTRRNFPAEVTKILVDWFEQNRDHPFPSDETKNHLCQQTGLTKLQVNDWFINARRRRGKQASKSNNSN